MQSREFVENLIVKSIQSRAFVKAWKLKPI